ncbi:MAG: DMT family transporter [Limnochordia bacterium]|jgi:transporter family-2 protein|nr:DMT family transporter [Limnochordia bacterium]
MTMLALVLAALSGVLMALQGSLNTAMAKIVGLLEGTFIVHLVGTVLALILVVLGLGQGNLAHFAKAPWYAYLGGVLSVGIIYLVAAAISKLGVAPATTAIIVGQVFTAALVDHFGWFGLEPLPFSLGKALGILLMAGGAWLLLSR